MKSNQNLLHVWIVPATLVLAGLCWSYWNVLTGMYEHWMANEDFSHGVLIAPIAGYLIWERRAKLAVLHPVPDWRGIVMMFIAIILYIIGELGAELFTTRIAVLFLCVGAVWWIYGSQVLHTLAFPLSVLFLMLPLPGFIYRNLTFFLQILSSKASVDLLNWFGYLAYREGNVIDMGFERFQVVDACNGLRFIMPMFTLGVLFAFMRPLVWWKRWVLVVSTIPMAMATNILRIVGTGILAKFYGIRVAEGFFHDFSGWAVFMASFVLFLLLAMALKKIPGEPRPKESTRSNQDAAFTQYNLLKRVGVSLIAFIICLISPIAVNVLSSVDPVPLKKDLSRFPIVFAGRSGQPSKMDPEMWKKVGAHSYTLINFHKAEEPVINFYTAYYEYQKKAGDFIHSPKLCLPGEGWFIASNQKRALNGTAFQDREGEFRFNELVIEKADRRQLVYYWYQGRNRNFTSEYTAKFYMVWDGILRRRTDGALVRMVMPLPSAMSVNDGRVILDRFAAMASIELDNYLP
jgi:exosortase D (VPLPA-CTERM-specific)